MYPVRLYLKQRFNLIILLVSCAFILGQIAIILFMIGPRPDDVFLQYNILFGVNLRGPWYALFTLPGMSALIMVINAIIGWLTFDRDKFMAFLLNTVAFLCIGLITIATILLMFLNV